MAEGGEEIDFDTTTEDGRTDINDDEISDLDPLLKDRDLGKTSWMKRFREFFSNRGRDMSDQELEGYERTPGEDDNAYRSRLRSRLRQGVVEFEMHNLRGREARMGSAAEEVKKRYPDWDPKKKVGKSEMVLVGEDEYGRVTLRLGKKNSKPYFLDEPENFPKTMKETLGERWDETLTRNEEVITDNENTIERNEKEIERLEERNDPTDREQIEELGRENEQLDIENEQLDRENEAIKEKVSLKERIKDIFKKAGGITLAAVLTATLVVTGFILSKLKAGLSAMRRGLKDLGKKVAGVLPWLIGSITSFLFKTVGEVVGFVAKNAWLLIVAVVVYVVERYKNKKR